MDKVLNFINELNIDKNKELIVACSGGPDSMFLLCLLKKLDYKVVCAHVNHKMRSESDYEYEFMEEYCKNNDIIFEGIILDGYEDGNFENYAREFRYNFFEQLVNKYNSEYVFTAHHGDDLMETILMRLVRGSSLKGYAGFSKITKKKNYTIIRPLIFLTKDYIENYNKEYNIPFVIDESNNTDDYTRNRYRHHVLPFLKSEEENVHERFLLFSSEIKDCVNYLDSYVEGILNNIYINNELDLIEFNKLDPYIKKRVVLYIIHLWYPDNLYLINNNHIDNIMSVIDCNKPNLEIELSNSIYIIKEYDKLIFKDSKIETNSYKYELKDSISLPNGKIIIVDKEKTNSNYVIRLNSKDIKLPLFIRTRKDGDKISIKNMNGSKKVNDIFIDCKIPKSKRDTWPILVDSNDTVLWIPGLKKSKFDIAINNDCDIIVKYVNEEERL